MSVINGQTWTYLFILVNDVTKAYSDADWLMQIEALFHQIACISILVATT